MNPEVFIVIGMPRAGTTFLYHTLGLHPEIFVPYRKESHYFSVNYGKGHAWYRALYNDMKPGQVGADINPLYYLDPQSLQRIIDFSPDVKVILSVRDPLSFAISQYGNILAMGWDAPGIVDWARGYEWRLSDAGSIPLNLADGFQQRRIEEIKQRFAGRLLLYRFDYFQADPVPVLKEIEDFLGLGAFFDETNVENRKINASARRNARWLNSLLTHQRFLETLYRVLPNPVIRKGRILFDRLSVSPSADAGPQQLVTDQEQQALQVMLEGDTRHYQALFADNEVIRV